MCEDVLRAIWKVFYQLPVFQYIPLKVYKVLGSILYLRTNPSIFFYYMKDSIALTKTTFRNSIKTFKSSKNEIESDSEFDIMIGISKAEEHLEKTSNFTVSGIFTLIASVYKIKKLMKVDVQYKNLTEFSFITFITACLNLEMVVISCSSYCPMGNLDAVSKTFIKRYFADCHIIISLFDNLLFVSSFSLFSLHS